MNNRNTALHLGAIAAAAFDLGVPVAQITVARCNNALGFVQFGDNANLLPTLSDLEAQLKVALASPVGNLMFCGYTTHDGKRIADSSSTANVERAHAIVKKMQMLGDPRGAEVIIEQARASVLNILGANQRNVHRIADALVREGTLSAHALQQVIGGE